MKKVLLTAMTLVGIASSTVFGMYGNDKSWIDFLVHGNQLRARMDQFGFTLGNGTIKGTFGFKGNTGGMIFDGDSLVPTVSGGIGYTSEMIGVGVGYAYTHNKGVTIKSIPVEGDINVGVVGMHTPVLMVNALNNNLRIAVPVSVATKEVKHNKEKIGDYLGISLNPEIRYYTGIDALNHIRLTLRYGQNTITPKVEGLDKATASSFGFEFRVDFLKNTIGNVIVAPFFRVKYNTALDAKGKAVAYDGNGNPYLNINAATGIVYYEPLDDTVSTFDHNPYDLSFELPLGLSANSDALSLYLEPAIGYKVADNGNKDHNLSHALTWGAYSELYLTPVKDLEFYFEMGINGNIVDIKGQKVAARDFYLPVYFETSTGITWYLPSLDGSAQ